MRRDEKILLGFTNDNEIVFGNVSLYDDYRFSASFETSRPIIIKDDEIIDELKSRLEQMDVEWLYNTLLEYDCAPSELADKIFEEKGVGESIEWLYDTSLYPEVFSIEGVEGDIHFESSASGQHDTRGEMNTYTNKYLYDLIHNLWDEYHLKIIPEEKVQEVFNMIEIKNDVIDENEYVKKWLIKLNENGEI